jgi:hypothetical protein
VRQLDRQIVTQFYERTALSRNKAAMLTRGAEPRADDSVPADEELARYALDGLMNDVLAREYRLVLPDEGRLEAEIVATRNRWERKPSEKRMSRSSSV